jgi:hypothetical protein
MVRSYHQGHKRHSEKLEKPHLKPPSLEGRISPIFFVFFVPVVVFPKKVGAGFRQFSA